MRELQGPVTVTAPYCFLVDAEAALDCSILHSQSLPLHQHWEEFSEHREIKEEIKEIKNEEGGQEKCSDP